MSSSGLDNYHLTLVHARIHCSYVLLCCFSDIASVNSFRMGDRIESRGDQKPVQVQFEVIQPTSSTEHSADAQHDYAGAQAKTNRTEIRLVHKLDLRIMPVLWFMYFLNYVDRGALSQAKLNSLESDLNMHGEDFNTAVSILVIGYVLMQIPSNMLLTRVRPSVYLASCMFCWSIISSECSMFGPRRMDCFR